ncbi:MAG: sulfatase-like hydrolase/transferase [Planctomycetota bacterium]
MARTRTIVLSAAGACALAAAFLASGGCDHPRDPATMPDVLLVSLDTLRADRLSCYGNAHDTSPVIDALAARGLRFADAMAPSGNTAPSHMSVLTGLHPLAHGVMNRDLDSTTLLALNEQVPTLAQVVAEAGWSTAAITQDGQLLEELGFGRGFETTDFVHDDFQGRIASLDRYLATQAPDRPQFVFLHTYEPHGPYLPPRSADFETFYGRYTDASYDGPFRTVTERLMAAPPGAKIATEQLEAMDDPGPDDVRFLSDLYDENVRWTDHLVGKLFDAWSLHRDMSNTIVVLFSDHGEQFMEHGAFGHHGGLWQEIVHVPLVVAGPGVDRRVVAETVSLTGLPAALLALLDVDAPGEMEPALGDLGAAPGEAVSRPGVAIQQMLLRSRGVAFHGATDADGHYLEEVHEDGATEFLFDRAADRAERANLLPGGDADALRRAVELARTKSLAFARAHPVQALGDGASEELRKQLELLGYLGKDE